MGFLVMHSLEHFDSDGFLVIFGRFNLHKFCRFDSDVLLEDPLPFGASLDLVIHPEATDLVDGHLSELVRAALVSLLGFELRSSLHGGSPDGSLVHVDLAVIGLSIEERFEHLLNRWHACSSTANQDVVDRLLGRVGALEQVDQNALGIVDDFL